MGLNRPDFLFMWTSLVVSLKVKSDHLGHQNPGTLFFFKSEGTTKIIFPCLVARDKRHCKQFVPPVVCQSVETSLKPLLDFSISVFQHDEESNCGNLGSNSGKGRYLMFPYASDGMRENNDKLSPCSIAHISKILQLKKDECFVGKNFTFHGIDFNG